MHEAGDDVVERQPGFREQRLDVAEDLFGLGLDLARDELAGGGSKPPCPERNIQSSTASAGE